LDGKQDSKNFLKNLKITWTFQDPLNETKGFDDFIFEFNYKLGSSQQEFVYLSEPVENTSFLNTYALNYSSWSSNILNIDWNYPSLEKSISPIYLKDETWNLLPSFESALETRTESWKVIIESFSNSINLKNTLLSQANVKVNWKT